MRWVFWSAVVVIGYTYAGYPAWLWVRSRLKPWPVQTGANEPFVSIVMVVRNEEKMVARKMENLLALDYPEQNAEVVVVSDGSTDGTEAILRDYAHNPRVHAVSEPIVARKGFRTERCAGNSHMERSWSLQMCGRHWKRRACGCWCRTSRIRRSDA